jgi:hypothetical protein
MGSPQLAITITSSIYNWLNIPVQEVLKLLCSTSDWLGIVLPKLFQAGWTGQSDPPGEPRGHSTGSAIA